VLRAAKSADKKSRLTPAELDAIARHLGEIAHIVLPD